MLLVDMFHNNKFIITMDFLEIQEEVIEFKYGFTSRDGRTIYYKVGKYEV